MTLSLMQKIITLTMMTSSLMQKMIELTIMTSLMPKNDLIRDDDTTDAKK